ncbi:metalloregulator ArsR/SmtB family transcription factor [Noviherbaspirillum sp. CPCC 100848]|uniref:Metalloregulator ArsR/SmtB family transcription factor n=1 Tax=Noviherbaspirillum album TaxID=3080276 RepID=A0ABU6J1Z3_9BURK|nr:metalloregulator ArsR/SmtB family transcription factor [Noviherbaspirillum sp. CPCC 100848]MEC4717570.1 metalloregulator ArsR/SmtB family transcription factor [Noviherbaspirillum sp. CPCC 100848]
MDVKNVVVALAALAQETRLAVFRLLVQSGPSGVAATQIAEGVGIAPSLLSFHLKELLHAGLISQTREGRSLIYAANFDAMNGVVGYLTENCCGGNVCSPVRVSNCSDEGACS